MYLVRKNVVISAASVELIVLLVTVKKTLLHTRPPAPCEPERSKGSESQVPITDGAEIDTMGRIGVEGAVTITEVAFTYAHDKHVLA